MSHHGPGALPPEQMDRMRKIFGDDIAPLGATGRFPAGKLTPDDEGEIRIAIGSREGKVVIDFGKPTAWIGFDPTQARDIAACLIKHADEIDPR